VDSSSERHHEHVGARAGRDGNHSAGRRVLVAHLLLPHATQ
jgi:hypothetical protein